MTSARQAFRYEAKRGLLAGAICAATAACSAKPSVVARPSGPLELPAAREYVLALVNRDRKDHGLSEVERDKVAERAAQEHADDMAHFGYTAHWGSDGSVPEERYTLAGGDQFVQENAACFGDSVVRELVENPNSRRSSSRKSKPPSWAKGRRRTGIAETS